jgi:hypothetical protein
MMKSEARGRKCLSLILWLYINISMHEIRYSYRASVNKRPPGLHLKLGHPDPKAEMQDKMFHDAIYLRFP